MLGKSAKYLRMLGYDTIYPPPDNDNALIKLASRTNRIILTRSADLYNSTPQKDTIILIHANQFSKKFKEIINKTGLQFRPQKLYTRCLLCNNKVKKIKKSEIKEQLPEKVKKHFDVFMFCSHCEKIYWRGGHTKRMISKAKQYFI
ncbi:MAG: Mut7-C RNAse domain-containing protein [Candidatus Marinimicrobia bacterium]|nr:Mut7-C RNAse domain-containing protein [Candidatus Neomarinimicrobiota bacterium]